MFRLFYTTIICAIIFVSATNADVSIHPTSNKSGSSRFNRRIRPSTTSSSLPSSSATTASLTTRTTIAAAAVTPTAATRNKSSKRAGVFGLPALPSWSRQWIEGGTSRAIAQAVLYPVDALRTLAQTRDGRTLMDVGSSALVRGCVTTSSFALAQGAIQFGMFDLLKYKLKCNALISSAIAAAGSCVVSVPQECIKQNLVTGVYSSFREAVTLIYQTKGIAGFYNAWRPTMARNVPFVITTFTVNDYVKTRIMNKKRQQHGKKKAATVGLSPLENLTIGISSAFLGGIVTNPIDVVKTRMMTQAASNAIPYTNAIDCFVTILKQEGWQKFYSGFKQRSVYMCGLWGITFALKGYMNNNQVKTTKTTSSE